MLPPPCYVLQSSPGRCPDWMRACMRSVHDWATHRGFRYVCIPNADFLAAVPAWFRAKAGGRIQPVTDLGRVEAAISCLDQGARSVVWIDADVLVFDPHLFELPDCDRAAFTREIWLDCTGPTRTPYCLERVNNAVLVARDWTFLKAYREACLRIGRQCAGPLDKSAVGTRYLTNRQRRWQLPLVRHVGNFSPLVSRAVLRAERPLLDAYSRALGEPLFAANLSASYENIDYFGTLMTTDDYDRLVAVLLDTAGAALRP